MRTLTSILLLVSIVGANPIDQERATEDVANRLIEFAKAWKKGDAAKMRGFMAKEVLEAAWPKKWDDFADAPLGKVMRVPHVAPTPQRIRRHEASKELIRFAKMHKKIEHLSLQPTRSIVGDRRMQIEAKLEIVGVGAKGERLWTRAKIGMMVIRGAIIDIRPLGIETRVVLKPPFTEVGLDVGFVGIDPPALKHPTLGLAAYGAAAADVDGDGDIDLFSTGHDGNTLFVNQGDGKYAAVAVPTPRQATAPLFLDYDNDGDADLFCSCNGEQMLLENQGELKFVDISKQAGIAVKSIGFTATAGDINGDGVPDIYVAAYNNYGPVAPASWDDAENGLPNLLFVSNGDGTYTECATQWGVAGQRWSYAAQFLDFDGDGKLDLYVANDFGAGNRLYLHRGDKFEDAAKAWGVWDGGYGMGVEFGDYDNDGVLDLYVTKMSSTAGNRLLDKLGTLANRGRLLDLASGNALYRGLGDKFEDATSKAGPFPAGWSWGAGFVDIDNDGFEDIYSPNGHFSGKLQRDT